jgi:uncharacterized protein YbjT (DUF2867 family)
MALDAALTGVDAVVDAMSYETADRNDAVAYFGTTTRNLLAAKERAGVRHHVLLSIVGVDRIEGNAHYAGEREQERLVTEGPVPWTIVRVTQFHDFAAQVTSWIEQDGVATIAPLLVQPIAPADAADVLAEIATGAPQGRYRDVAGPEPQDLVDMARRTNDARGHAVKLVPTWSSLLGPEMAGDVLLPGVGARIAPTNFDEWLGYSNATNALQTKRCPVQSKACEEVAECLVPGRGVLELGAVPGIGDDRQRRPAHVCGHPLGGPSEGLVLLADDDKNGQRGRQCAQLVKPVRGVGEHRGHSRIHGRRGRAQLAIAELGVAGLLGQQALVGRRVQRPALLSEDVSQRADALGADDRHGRLDQFGVQVRQRAVRGIHQDESVQLLGS